MYIKFDESTYLDYVARQELDRKRISSELHDTSLQHLTHIIHQIELSSMYMDVDITRAKLELADVNKQLRQITQDIRNTIFDLRPMSFDDLGFIETVRQYTLFIEKKYPIRVVMEQVEEIDDLFSQDQCLAMYRVIQECLMNSAKHSEGKKITISIYKKENSVIIEICDDGVGISTDNKDLETHYGLQIIHERVTYLKGLLSFKDSSDLDNDYVTSIKKENVGTCIEISIPFCES